MKARFLLTLLAVLTAGCQPVDLEASLYQTVQRDRSQSYTIYNYPSIFVTSGEQQVRAQKQAEAVRNHVEVGMKDSDLVGIFGRPNDIKKSTYPSGTLDTFIYESTGGRYMQYSHYYFIFRDKLLESWHKM